MAPTSDWQREQIRGEALNSFAALLEQHDWPQGARGHALSRYAAWLHDELLFTEILELAPSLVESFSRRADPDMALRNWDRYFAASFNRQALLHLLLARREHLDFLADLFSFSQFFSDIVVRNPEYLDWCLADAVLDREKRLEEYRAQLAQFVRPFKSPESRRRALVRFKRRELLRIGVRGLRGHGSMAEQCRELSRLAEAACELAFDDSWQLLLDRHGMPSPREGRQPRESPGFAVVAMGKFGGEELNFSSDIDLVFVYDAEGATAGSTDTTGHTSGRISNHEFYCKLANAVVQYLSYPTTEGPLYRVDTRLRPEGKSGAIARSLSGYTSYFASQARAWEKIPYIKARVVAGDRTLESPFLDRCHAFLYASNDPRILLPEMARLKRRIDFEALDARGRRLDIKRGPGGIREIEFIVSALQLLHGTRLRELRVRATLDALAILEQSDLIPRDDAVIFRDAYWFYRLVEHTLQMMEEQQTHALPEVPAHRRALAVRCRFDDNDAFEQTINDFRRFVRARFEELFHANGAAARLSLADKLEGSEPPDEETLAELRPIGLGTVEGFQALRELATGTREVAVSSEGQRHFERLLPCLLEAIEQAPMPVLAVRHLANLMLAHRSVSSLYALMLAHPPVLRLLVRTLGFGLFPARGLIAHPEWLDEMLEGDALAAHYSMRYMFAEQAAPRLAESGAEEALAFLRRFKEREALFLAAREIMGILSPRQAATQATELAEICLNAVCRIVSPEPPESAPWCLLALGGFGGRETHLSSDLDVAFFCDPDKIGDGDVTLALERIASGVLSGMSAVSPEGTLWKMDARLRPDGRNAPLMVSLGRARRYYAREANIWEFQSVTRARFVAGNPHLGTRVMALLREALNARVPFANLRGEIRSMRARLEETVRLPRHAAADIKRGPGGIVDIEFLVQFLQLSHGLEMPELLTPSMDEALDAIGRHALLDAEALGSLRSHHARLRTIQRAVRLLGETARDYLPAQEDKRGQLARALLGALEDPGDALDRLTGEMEEMRAMFEEVLSD